MVYHQIAAAKSASIEMLALRILAMLGFKFAIDQVPGLSLQRGPRMKTQMTQLLS